MQTHHTRPLTPKFSYRRSRGVVWVCDIVGSSRALNDDKVASSVEEFLPRFYWAARAMVEASGGVFIKWTGDGFLSWYETPLHRDLGNTAWHAYMAAYHLTLLVNITRLGVSGDHKFKIRHGVSYEQDALVTEITESTGFSHLDLIGRSVVLAFRMSGVQAGFPNIVTQRDLVKAVEGFEALPLQFISWHPSKEEKLQHFKGESWSTRSIYLSGQRKVRPASVKTIVRKARLAIEAAEGKRTSTYNFSSVIDTFVNSFCAGEDWCADVMAIYDTFVHDELLGSLKNVVSKIDASQKLHV